MAELFYNKHFKPSGQYRDIETLIGETIERDDFDSLFLIVPTGRLVRKLKQKTIRAYFEKWQKPLQKLKFFTLQKIVGYCQEVINGDKPYRRISDAYRLTLFEEASTKAEMSFYKSEGRKLSPAVLARLASVIYGLKEDGITPESMIEETGQSEDPGTEIVDINKFSDIANLYVEYQKLLGDTLFDPAEELNAVNRQYDKIMLETGRNMFDGVFKPGQRLLFYGFSDFKTPEIKFISNFADAEVETAVIMDYHKDNGPLFGNFEEAKSLLFDAGFSYTPSPELEELIENKSIDKISLKDYLRRWLFSPETEIRNPGFEDKIEIFAAGDRYDEVESICRLIKYLCFHEGLRPDEICVAFRQPDLYSPLFREAFYLNRIAANITDRHKTDRSPVTVAVFALLNIILKGYGREDINKALHSTFLKFDYTDGEGNQRLIDGTNLYETALKLKISGGTKRSSKDYWVKRLESVIRREEDALKSLAADPGSEEMEIYSRGRELEKYRLALEDIKALSRLLPDKAKEYTPGEFASLIRDGLCGRFRIMESIQEMYSSLSEKKVSMSRREYGQLLEEIEKYARALSGLLAVSDELSMILAERFGDRKFKLDELAERFKTAITAAKFQVREKGNMGVTITSIEQTRGLDFKAMILCGAVDGEFPMVYRPESFLGKELSLSERRHLQSERMQFYQFLTNSDIDGNTKYYIFFPKFNGNDELVRSPFIDSLLKVTELESQGKIHDLPAIRKEMEKSGSAGLPWLNIVSSTAEAAYHAGKAAFGNSRRKEGESEMAGPGSVREGEAEYLKCLAGGGFFRSENCTLDTNEMSTTERAALEASGRSAYSISSLETYAACPYKYFASKGLGFEEKITEDAALTPLEKGTLLHAILYEFYSEKLKKSANEINGIRFVRLNPELKAAYLSELSEIAGRLIERYEHDHAYYIIDKDELFGFEGRNGILEMWLNSEMERVENGWGYHPAMFELSFGIRTSSGNSQSQPIALSDRLKLRGKIDRVEIHRGGDGIHYLVADYKTRLKSAKSNEEIKSGKAFQMPLYLCAARKLMQEKHNEEIIPDGSVYYALKPELKEDVSNGHKFALMKNDAPGLEGTIFMEKPGRTVLGKDKDIEQFLADSVTMAEAVVDGIARGDYKAKAKRVKECQWCSFDKLCRLRDRGETEGDEETSQGE